MSPATPVTSFPLLSVPEHGKRTVHFRKNQIIFSQGDRSDSIFYVETGCVKLTVISRPGKEAVVGFLCEREFFGGSSLCAERPARLYNAIAITDTRVVKIDRSAIIRVLRSEGGVAYAFITCLLHRKEQMQEDLVDNLVSPGKQRLARVLRSLEYRKTGQHEPVPRLSQQDLGNMIGVTRQRVNFLLKQLRKSGFLDSAGGLRVHSSVGNAAPKRLGRDS